MTTDVVCVLDANLAQVFERARPIKATVKEDSKAMEHPLETGAVVTDHRVILPTEIQLSLVLASEDFQGTYRQIRDLFTKGELLTVQTRTDSYPNMAITSLPHDETADTLDAVTLALALKEVKYVEAQFTEFKVAKPKDAKTVQRGEQQPQPKAATERSGSILSGLFK
jgi:hypothetical protein